MLPHAARTPAWQPPPEFDEYKLVSPLGRGRTGLVFVAHDTLLDRHVAVKFIPARDETLLARFLHEARAAARMQHPNVATLYRVGRLDAQAYLVWELVLGKSLDQLKRPVDPERMLRIAIDVARGLAAAHRRGVLHRDIKPGNIVVADSGEAKLVDFGLAALLDVPSADPAVTPKVPESRPGDETAPPADGTIGTAYFMSPEAWRGDAIDARSDLYSFGLVLYELLAGEGPFRHLLVKELAQAIQTEPPRPLQLAAPGVPAGFALIVDRCLRHDRTARFGSAAELLAALDSVSPSRGSASIPEGNPYRGLRTYEAEHRALFFGRTRPLQLALERLRAESLLVVTGDSGVGKSSLCAAGLLPLVAEGGLEDGRRWLVGRTVPGRAPLRNIASTVAQLLGISIETITTTIQLEPTSLGRVVRASLRDELGLLLYIDQMEELVTQQPAGEAPLVAQALASLADGLPGVRVLGTARSDFLSRLAGLPGLQERLPPALLLLGPMSPADVREAIVGPASLKGAHFESDELIESLVDSTLTAEGSLPLLQFTLAELWERRARDTNTITATALASVGGVSGALARHADAVLIALSPADRVLARQLLLRLVTIDDTRARRTEEELRAISPNASAVLESLVRGRLLVASESPEGATFEIAHEALVRGWGTLAHWLVDEAELRAARHRLELAASEWQRAGKRRDLLWSARQLAELDERVLDGLAARDRMFIEQSRSARRTTRWIRRGLAAGVLLAVAGTWVGAEVLNQRELDRAIRADLATAEEHWRAARTALDHRAAARKDAFDAWDRKAAEEGERAWKLMQARATEAGALLADTAGELERALLRDPDRDDVRGRYADLLLERALLAEAEGRSAERAELVTRLALYDSTGERRRRFTAPAGVIVATTPPSARLQLTRADGELPAIEVASGARTEAAAGSWILTASAPGFVETRLSLILTRSEEQRVTLALPRDGAIPPGFVYMPRGAGLFGSSDAEAVRAWFNAVPQHPVVTDAFIIARHETTFADWIAFLDELPPEERERRRPRVAGTGFRGMLELSQRGGDWHIALQPTDHMLRARRGELLRYPKRDRRAEQDWTRFPVSGISYGDAEAYAMWLDRTARVKGARMCTEHEWERAARGTHDRAFPHGNVLAPDDANFDETYGKQSGGFGPDEVGSHPASTSPFGVADLVGNVWEWVASSIAENQVVARGGSYYFAGNTARVTNRELPEASYRDLTVGVRICASGY
ncbi:MAG: SUMF1/EgtB/PvdO family nonheme iron enzyme [Myxococcota bacterium]|nr:SUMF1/EgtB/PvdO family nonheme iron enzyme [Myxococcota bacterium]